MREMNDAPAHGIKRIQDAAIHEEFAQIGPHILDRRGIGRTQIDQENGSVVHAETRMLHGAGDAWCWAAKNVSILPATLWAGDNGIAQGNAVAGVSGHKQARRLRFHVVHQRAVFSEAQIVLRNGLAIDGDVLKSRPAPRLPESFPSP